MELPDYEEGFDELGRTMRKQDKSVNEAAKYFEGKSVSEKMNTCSSTVSILMKFPCGRNVGLDCNSGQ